MDTSSAGIHLETLRGWHRRARAAGEANESSGRPPRMVPPLEEKNRRLRRESARLLEERDILKKATVFVAKAGAIIRVQAALSLQQRVGDHTLYFSMY